MQNTGTKISIEQRGVNPPLAFQILSTLDREAPSIKHQYRLDPIIAKKFNSSHAEDDMPGEQGSGEAATDPNTCFASAIYVDVGIGAVVVPSVLYEGYRYWAQSPFWPLSKSRK